MIEPVSDALTTSIRPACSAKNAMISSAMLPNVALRMPPTCGPVSAPRRSVDRPTTQARPRIAAADDDEQDGRRRRGARSRARSRPTLTTTRPDERRRAPSGDSAPRIGQADPGMADRSCSHPIGPLARRRGPPRQAGRRPRRAWPPRPGPCPRRPAARPRRARAVERVAPRPPGAGRPPGHAPTTSDELAAGRDSSVRRRAGELAERRPGRSPRGAWSARGRPPPADPRRTPRRGRAASRRPARAPRTATVAALVGGDPREPLPPLAARSRQEPLERPARPGDAARHERRQHGRRARDRHDPRRPRPPRPRPGRAPGSLTSGRAGVGHERQVRAARAGARAAPPVAPGPLRAW